jgi:hypothetical protein
MKVEQNGNNSSGAGSGEEIIPSINDVVIGEGKTVEVFDRESNTLYKEGDEQEGNEGKGDPQQQQNKNTPPTSSQDDGQGEYEELEFLNIPDLVVNKIMGNNIEFPANMSNEEQAKVVYDSILDIKAHYEAQTEALQKEVETLKSGNPAMNGSITPSEAGIINQLRSGKKLHEIAAANVVVPIDLENKEEVIKFAIRKDNPSWTEEEVTEELDEMKTRNKLDKFYKTYRGKVEGWQKESGQDFETKYQQEMLAIQKKEQEDIQQEIQQVNTVLSGVKEFHGIEIQPEMKTMALRFSTEINPKSGNTYLMDLLSTPEGVAEVALLKLYGQQLFTIAQQNALKEGKKMVFKEFPKNPVVNAKERVGQQGAYDLEKLTEVTHIGSI